LKKSKVAVIKGGRSVETVLKALKPIIDPEKCVDKPIMIKVNFISIKKWDTGATTDPIVVEALIRFFKPYNDQIFVVESDATITKADEAARATGIIDLCQKYNISFQNLGKYPEMVEIKVPNPETLSTIRFPKIVLQSHVISAAKMKTHSDTKVTLGLKNMFGLLTDRPKSRYHSLGISNVIVDINAVFRPILTVIDGFIAMEGSGPVSGSPIKMDLVITGRDVVATDAVASKIMGFEPTEIHHIKRVAELGLGNIENIELIGEDLKKVARKFKRA
jgi:uncharacterized protein (DUF362 family)